jgi:hypothetical protein
MSAKYEIAANKGCWPTQVWVEVEAIKVSIYKIIAAKEGLEAWIPVGEEKVSRN